MHLESDFIMSKDQCVTRTFDEFQSTTHIVHKSAITSRTGTYRVRSGESAERSWIAIDFSTMKDHWPVLNKGGLILNCDQENIRLPFILKEKRKDGRVWHWEEGHWLATSEQLQMICSAAVLKIRVQGGKYYYDENLEFSRNFQNYCRQFYNNAIDDTKYIDSLGRSNGFYSGCFIATAAMGSYEDPCVQALSKFRDLVLCESRIGRAIIDLYYHISPSIASRMAPRPWVCRVAKYVFVLPVSLIARALTHWKMVRAIKQISD